MASERICGECTACCLLTEVPELKKPVNELCELCDPEKGCSAYETRPLSCRRFICLWLQNEGARDSMRPDRCGVMFERLDGEQIILALFLPGRLEEKNDPMVKRVMDSIVANGFAIVGGEGGLKSSFMRLPRGVTQEMVTEGMKRFWSRIRENSSGRTDLCDRPQ